MRPSVVAEPVYRNEEIKIWSFYIHVFKMASAADILHLIEVMLDPRNVIFGQSVVLEFCVDRISSFWDIAVFIFLYFGVSAGKWLFTPIKAALACEIKLK